MTSERQGQNDDEAQAEAETRESPGARIAVFSWYGIGVALVALAAGAWFGLTAPVVLGALVAGTGLVARGWAAICLWGVTARRSLDGARAFPAIRFRSPSRSTMASRCR